MKRILTTCLATAILLSAKAQEPDKALARVRYTFTHVRDTTERDKPKVENMLLVTGKNASVFTSYDKLNQTLNMQKQIQEQIKNQAGNGNLKIEVKSETKVPLTQEDYFFFANEHKMITKERLFNNYLIEEPATAIDWKILKDTMSFSGVACQKATAHFKGRNWTAWFATEIPFQSGPWKLNGLPGLIIEAYDDKKDVKFEFAGLEYVKDTDAASNSDGEVKIAAPSGGIGAVKIVGIDVSTSYLGPEIKLPTDAIKTTRKELDKLKAARDKDPQGFMQAQMAASGMQGSFKTNQAPRQTSTTVAKDEVNNPVEIEDKK
ncbi:GLPGLI family protein [Pedobacter sp. KBS0701]|uniref:GLPGLI family protein n=1 Tax=Pedobacter sp. KBS0701 TaxID=2578106 RepID=UPI00110F0B20|nr:GLPGLI family protein [Pedobacter sp. KBS0701]QDW25418.1 GLPGLI family protein [Pedobacter sp. KBS0701]